MRADYSPLELIGLLLFFLFFLGLTAFKDINK
jgi:hypothetical protein